MKLEGSLDAFSLPDIFALLSMTKKSGGLHLRRAQAHGVVWFTTGAITGGVSDLTRQALARRIVGAGLVEPDALKSAVERAVTDDTIGVARALQQAGDVDEGSLHDIVAEHVVDTVFDLLRWPDGEFAFALDEANPDEIGVSRDVDEVVAEARRRLEAWGSVATSIPSPLAVLTVQTTLDADPQLTRDEWALLALVDGRRTVAQIVMLAGRGEFAVVSALAGLVTRGLVRVSDGNDASTLLSAHDLLAALEDSAVASPPSRSSRRPIAEPAVVEEVLVEDVDVTDNDDADDVDDDPRAEDEPARLVTSLAAVPAQPGDGTEITPKRPEPFLPKRRPEHPEEPMPAVAAVGGGSAPAPAAAAYIERDPSVNKSLLLRLIAGVRGL